MLPAGEALARRNNWRLTFPFGDGYQATVRRIHVLLPVFLEELNLETTTAEDTNVTQYETEEEAGKRVLGFEGQPTSSSRIQAIGGSTRYESVVASFTYKANKRLVEVTEKTTTKRSLLPVTITVVVRLNGPEGAVWAESYEVPVGYAFGVAGKAKGVGLVDAYADLVNGLVIPTPQSSFSMEILLLVPAAVFSNAQIGLEVLELSSPAPGTQGKVAFFYDLETVPVGK